MPSSPTEALSEAVESRGAGAEDTQLTPFPRFSIDVALAGQRLRLGQPFELRATVTSHLQSASPVLVSIRMPDLEVAKRNSWKRGRVPFGEQIPVLRDEMRVFASGQVYTSSVTAVIPVAGLYRVTVVAHAQDEPKSFVDGHLVQNFVAVERWIWIDENGARVTEQLRDAVVPDSVFPQPGVRRLRESKIGDPLAPRFRTSDNSFRAAATSATERRGTTSGLPAMALDLRDASANVAATIQTPGMVSGRVGYYKPNTNIFEGVSLLYTYYIWDDYENQYLGSNFGLTGADGSFAFACPDPNDFGKRHDLSFAIQSFSISINNGAIAAGQYRGNDCHPSGIDGDFVIDSNEGIAMKTLERVVSSAYTVFGRARSIVYVSASGAHAGSDFTGPNSIRLASANGFLHTPYGHFVMAHEYGHALHFASLGGYAGGTCPDPHLLNGAYNMDCAWAEGFANFFALATLPGSETAQETDFENNANYPGGNGSLSEGAVGAFLHDLMDTAIEPHDSLSFPGSYIAALVTTCHRVGLFGSVHGTRVPHFIYCLENQVDPTAQSFFPGDYSILAYAEQATEPSGWSAQRIRRSWLKNLFNQ